MKSTIFHLSSPTHEEVEPENCLSNEIFTVPTLPAYAILNHTLDCSSAYIEGVRENLDYTLDGDKVIIKNANNSMLFGQATGVLSINYSGIRDYQLLFPQVKDNALKERLGQFAEEADKAFEAGAWMSFTVMVASVIEGILFNVYDNDRLNWLIKEATKDSTLTSDEAALLDSARVIRNAIHAGRFKDAIADRTIGNDLYIMYDHLIKKNWQ